MRRAPVGTEESLLGFDAREGLLLPSTAWDAARRGTYLLRDAPKPLSVDAMVWPSLFGAGPSTHERARPGLDALEVPEWRGPNAGLWDDLERMRVALAPCASEAPCCVAVSWVSADGFSKPSPSAGPHRARTTPPTIHDDWRLLGFDVADAGLTSGLTNCGYGESERSLLGASWASGLNEHHLFVDAERALAFARLTDRRVPEHAPFSVYALYLIADCPMVE